MAMEDPRFERIDDYLNGRMNREEKLRFEEELKGNEELNALFNIYNVIETEMQTSNQDEEALLAASLKKLNAVHYNQDQKRQSIKQIEIQANKGRVVMLMNRRWLIAAATIALIIMMGVPFYLQYKNQPAQVADNTQEGERLSTDTAQNGISHHKALQHQDPDQTAKDNTKNGKSENKIDAARRQILYAKNFIVDAAPEDKAGPLEDAFADYENGEYRNAINAIDNADPYERTRGEEADSTLTVFYSHYYKGLSFMAESNFSKAIPELKTAIAGSADESLQLKAQWYLALAYLKASDIRKANELLNQVAKNSEETEYKLKASKLLNELKQ